jgi:hypothetical protein
MALVLAGCAASPSGPYFHDEQYLVVGVDPNRESAALTRQLEQRGYPLLARQEARDFTALGFGDPEGRPSRVRVVTARGIALALDPVQADAVARGVRYRLLPPPLHDTRDADGDGFDEVFVQALFASGDPPCIAVYRVRDSGFVDPVPGKGYALSRPADARDAPWLAPDFCESPPAPPAPGPAERTTVTVRIAPPPKPAAKPTPRPAAPAPEPSAPAAPPQPAAPAPRTPEPP